MKEWNNFLGDDWKESIDVEKFIVDNY